MKLYNDSTLKTDGVDASDVNQFTIKANGKAFHMLIAGLYGQKIDSVVREICSNAADAHRDANKANVPFDVELPTSLNPVFSVRDFGTGLPNDKLIKLFTTIFESTKENSNTDIGAFGLGSKSPYAITDQFTIESRWNGVLTTFLAYKDGGGVPSMMETGQQPTDDGNGITVRIPVQPTDIWNVQTALKRQLYFFPVKPTISGKDNDSFWFKPTAQKLIGARTYLEKTSAWTGHRVRMGPVSYPLDTSELEEAIVAKLRLFSTGHQGEMTITEFPMGALDLQPSREHLSYIPQTKLALNTYFAEMLAEYDRMLQDEFHAASTSLFAAIEWVIKINNEQAYSKSVKFFSPKFLDKNGKPRDISYMVQRADWNGLVDFGHYDQEEDHQQLVIVKQPDPANPGQTIDVPTQQTVKVKTRRAPFLSQSVSPRNKTIKKTYDVHDRVGLDQIRNLMDNKQVYVYIDNADRASTRVRHYVETEAVHVMMIMPNSLLQDGTKKTIQAYADAVAKVTGDAPVVISKFVNVSTLPLPPAKAKAPAAAKQAGHLSSVCRVTSSTMGSNHIWNVTDLPANAPYVVTERGNVDNKFYRSRVLQAAVLTNIISVAKSNTKEIKTLRSLGHVSLEEWIDERSPQYRNHILIRDIYHEVKDESLIDVPSMFDKLTNSTVEDYRTRVKRLSKLSEKSNKKLENCQCFIDLWGYFNDDQKMSTPELRRCPRLLPVIKELNALKRISRKMQQHPLMMLVSNLDIGSVYRMDRDKRMRLVQYVEDNFKL